MSVEAVPETALADSLLARLREGDLTCAERLFREYEPYLRFIVRKEFSSRLRGKFDSTDVLQSVWECVLRDLQARGLEFASSGHLKTYLVQIARHRFFDQIRRNRGPLKHETAGPADQLSLASSAPRPSEEAQAHDVWGQLLNLCPPVHRQVLQLKRQGLSLAEISEQTGIHADSIRRILRNLARRYSNLT